MRDFGDVRYKRIEPRLDFRERLGERFELAASPFDELIEPLDLGRLLADCGIEFGHLASLRFELRARGRQVALQLLPLGNIDVPPMAVHAVALDAVPRCRQLKLGHHEVLQIGQAGEAEGLERTAHRHLGRKAALASRRIRNPRHVHMRRSVLLVEMDGYLEPLDCAFCL